MQAFYSSLDVHPCARWQYQSDVVLASDCVGAEDTSQLGKQGTQGCVDRGRSILWPKGVDEL